MAGDDEPGPKIPEEIIEPLTHVIGAVILRWAFVEHMLTHCCSVIYHLAGGKHERPKLPFRTGDKIKFLRRCFETLQPLERFRDEALPILESAGWAAKVRNLVAHGALSTYESPSQRLTFIKINPVDRSTMYGDGRGAITFPTLCRSVDVIRGVSSALGALCWRLIREFPPPK